MRNVSICRAWLASKSKSNKAVLPVNFEYLHVPIVHAQIRSAEVLRDNVHTQADFQAHRSRNVRIVNVPAGHRRGDGQVGFQKIRIVQHKAAWSGMGLDDLIDGVIDLTASLRS
jgi:hypothetical protein